MRLVCDYAHNCGYTAIPLRSVLLVAHGTGGVAIADALRHNRTLQDLLLRTNNLGDAGGPWCGPLGVRR